MATPDSVDRPLPETSPSSGEYGPVTRLAHKAAIREERERAERRRMEAEHLKAQAAVVGETALAIAAATASGSPVRLSPQQREAMMERTPSGKKMSVAARARAAADLPAQPPQMPRPRSAGNGNGNTITTAPSPSRRVPRAPSSGGVMRGKFSKQQVKQMIDEWGRHDTSEDDDSDYYYDVTSESSAEAMEAHEQFKQTLERGHHHLQYTMSQSPGPTGVEGPEEAAAMAATAAQMPSEEELYHYQHHRVSNYANSKAGGSMSGRSNSPGAMTHPQDGGEEESRGGGIFASAKHWLQSQRDRLHQMELERQVEDQRRKLVEEGRKQRALEAERRRKNLADHASAVNDHHHLAGNVDYHRSTTPPELMTSGSAGCLQDGQLVGSGDGEQQEELCNIPEQGVVVSGMTNMCGFGGVYANNLDDSTDYSGVARIDSRGNIVEMVPSGSFDDNEEGEHMKVFMKVSSPKCTMTGKGMSVKVDLPDDDEYQEPENTAPNTSNNHAEAAEEEEEVDALFANDIKVVPEPPQDDITASPQILQQSQMKALIASGGLPPSLSFCKWKRLYSLTRDGDSFEQFLRLVEGHDRTVLVVKTTRGGLFGGYADTRWEARHVRCQANEFYGSAQACLFRFPNFGSGRGENKVAIYKWSGANRYIQLCDATRRTVAFGGGGDEGDFGLCIEDDFRRGTTGHCSTFENEALCEEGFFEVMDLEVWGFMLDF